MNAVSMPKEAVVHMKLAIAVDVLLLLLLLLVANIAGTVVHADSTSQASPQFAMLTLTALATPLAHIVHLALLATIVLIATGAHLKLLLLQTPLELALTPPPPLALTVSSLPLLLAQLPRALPLLSLLSFS